MQVTKNITLDLLETGSPVIIKAKQNDRNTRYIAAHLYVDGLAYPVPSGTEIAFRYKKPDGTAGFYDALPDNSPAITVSGNTVTVELVEQVLTVAGCVHCEINMYNATSEKLTTFTFEITVEESVLTDAEIISSDYYNVLTAEIAKALQAVTDATEQAENAAQSAQDAADSAAMSKDWAAGKPVTYSGATVSIAYAGANRIASITAYGENAQGGTTEAPVALTGVDSVFVGGRNLLPNKAETQTVHGITYTINKDKSVTVKGTSTDSWATLVLANKLTLPTGSYTLAGNGVTDDVMLIIAKDTSGTTTVRSAGKDDSVFSIASRRTNLIAYVTVKPNTTANLTIHPMLNLGSTILPYEPYQGSVTPLPIPRPLHEVGDVKDKCVTQVKSVYDRRIVIDQNSIINMSGEASIVGTSRRFNVPAEDIPITNDAVIEPVRCNILPARPSGGVSGTYALDAPGISLQNNQSVSQPNINIRVPGCKTLEEIKAWLTDNPLIVYYQSTAYDGTNGLDVCLTEYMTGYIESYADESITTAWISSTGALSTGAEVAYVLSSPETYATDPLDIDNAAGPLTVMTGGEVEVRMTELIGSRSDVSNNTVAFSEAAQDADIASGEKLSVLFGKIKKRMSVLKAVASNLNLLDNSDYKIAQAGYNCAHGNTAYLCDRWSKYLVDGSMTDDGMLLTPSGAGAWIIQYKLLTDTGLSEGDTVTLTVRVNGTVYSGSATLQIKSAAVDADSMVDTDDIRAAAFIPAGNTDQIAVYIVIKQTCTLTWTKLEKGSVATPYVPKGYGAELLECMRYYQKSEDDLYAVPYGGKSYIVHEFGVPMRVAPTVTLGYSPESREDQTASIYGFTVKFSGSSGLLDSWTASADL